MAALRALARQLPRIVGLVTDPFPSYDGYFLDLAALGEGDAVFYCDGTSGLPGWKLFSKPSRLLVAEHPEDVGPVVDALSRHEGWSAGFLSYEGSSAVNPVVRTKPPAWPMLAWFGLYDAPPELYRELAPCYEDCPVEEVEPEMDASGYRGRFERVKSALAQGRSYQVNLTFRLRFRTSSTPERFFVSRCGASPPRYAAYLHGGGWRIASFSPELMFERRAGDILCRPMKGTAPVPDSRRQIADAITELQHDPKSVAENLMIVDMVRNDLGSFCQTGSVRTEELFRVERHGGLLQMTSDVRGQTHAGFARLVEGLLPAASVTGAPKVETTGLIAELETSSRHVYCGAIGFRESGRERFSVGIRTALLHGDGTGEFGVGSGIVWDSDPDLEYHECLAKAEFLVSTKPQWSVIDALHRRDLNDPPTVDAHMARLTRTCDALGIPLHANEIQTALRSRQDIGPPKIRIVVHRDGAYRIEAGESEAAPGSIRAAVARRPVHAGDPNLRFKTTGRGVYDSFLNEHPEFDEVLLWNEAGEVTEFCRGSLIAHIGCRRLSPPPECGCLHSVSIALLVADGAVSYGRMRLDDIAQADRLLYVNAVTGLRPVALCR